jgi:3-phenylpropionate/trans-cinnamate dioxygenase ferredoxin component
MSDYQKVDPLQCDFFQIGPLSELPVGERLFLEIDQYAIVVFNIAGVIYAIADLCSHDAGPLGEGELDGFEISCPRHGARFDVRTGKVQSLPAIVDIPSYPIRIVDGQIEVGIPKD